jgi:hypothetical protein
MVSPVCGHRLCVLIGGACSLTAGVSRGCGAGPRPDPTIASEVFEEIGALLAVLAAIDTGPLASGTALDAAIRLAAIIRREARDGRSVLAQARDGEPELAVAIERLCTRSSMA